MLTPDYLLHVADDAVMLYQMYEDSLIADMARRIMRIGVTDASIWQIEAYQEAGGIFEDAMRRLAELLDGEEKAVRAAFLEAGARTIEYDNSIYERAGLTPLSMRQSPAMLQRLQAGAVKTSWDLKNLSLTTATSTQRAFIDAVNLAYMQVVSGGMEPARAIMGAVRGAAREGLTVLYPSGHTDHLDVAVRRAVRTGVSETCGWLQLMNMGLLAVDTVETTAHMGARTGSGIANHMEWQGRVYSLSGEGYPHFTQTTGFGYGDGLCGWNCRHSFMPFIPGVSQRAYSDELLREMKDASVTYNGKEMPLYSATQKQRAMEREIRKLKRELNAVDASMKAGNGKHGKEDYDALAAKLKESRGALKEFLGQTGLAAREAQVQVLGFGRSEASRASWAVRKKEQAVSALSEALMGLKTSTGKTVETVTAHFAERAQERGVTRENISAALQSPLKVGTIKTDNYGQKSQVFIGERATVALNPDTGVLVTVYPTKTKRAKSLTQDEE